jgi:hypothetical protein
MADEARSLKAYGELPDSSKQQIHHVGPPVSASWVCVTFAYPADRKVLLDCRKLVNKAL